MADMKPYVLIERDCGLDLGEYEPMEDIYYLQSGVGLTKEECEQRGRADFFSRGEVAIALQDYRNRA